MKRTDAEGFEADKNGAGRDGFKDTGPNPTTVDETWLNAVQEEISRSIELLGETLDENDDEQLGTLLVAMRNQILGVGTQFIGVERAMLGVTTVGAVSWKTETFATPVLFSRLNQNADDANLMLPFEILDGTTCTTIRVRVLPGDARATSGNRMYFLVYEQDKTTGVSTPYEAPGSVYVEGHDDGTDTIQWVSLPNIPVGGIVGSATKRYLVSVMPGIDGATNTDAVLGAEVTIALA